MAERKQTTLPDGEYLMLADERDEFNLLCGRFILVPGTDTDLLRDQHDHDSERSRTIALARLQRARELNPDRAPPTIYRNFPTLWQDRRFRFDKSLLMNTSYFYGPPPQHEIHYDTLSDFAREPSPDRNGDPCFEPGSYNFVSDAWKDAIEALEPGVHEFFPHTVEFARYRIYDHFLFRDAREVDFIDYEHSEKPGAVQWDDYGGGKGRYITMPNPVGFAAKRERIAGRHWIRQIGVMWPVVSRELASMLLPLLPNALETPDAIRFIPVILV